MDGIARNTAGLDVGLAGALGPVLVAAVLLLSAVLSLAIAGEVLRQAGRAVGFVRGIDHALPRPARNVAATAVALAVGVLGPTPAHAADAPVRDWLSGTSTTTTVATTSAHATDPVATEDRLATRDSNNTTATTVPATTTTLTPPAASTPADRAPNAAANPVAVAGTPYAVVEGDCLWSIAAARLRTDATNTEIDAAWRAIYAANRAAIGDDPDLIFPRLELELPPIDRPRDAP